MKKFIFLITLTISSQLLSLENTTCKKCHPVIYKEYQNSMHANASIYKDMAHKAVWDMHPAKKKGNYKCAKCHTPADHDLVESKSKLSKNSIQTNEPISCQTCHKIKSIHKDKRANKNIYTDKDRYFFSADKTKKGKKVIFKEQKSLFGLFTTTTGSPYHDIDYSNEIFYNGDVCLGCHEHKANSRGFLVCDMGIESKNSKQNCITCHMPRVKGSFVELKDSRTHASHRASIHSSDLSHLAKHIKLSLSKKSSGFEIDIKNEANHTLFFQPLRLNQLQVTIERKGKEIDLEPITFIKIIGSNDKPSMPWLATMVIKDDLIKAHEKRKVRFSADLQKGDNVVAKFGYYLVNPKSAKKLDIKDSDLTKFRVLNKRRFHIKQ